MMWKRVVELVRTQMTIWRMRIEFWIQKANNSYSEHVILIAFPVQKWLNESESILCYTYTVCLV
jgi:hypothetical protein